MFRSPAVSLFCLLLTIATIVPALAQTVTDPFSLITAEALKRHVVVLADDKLEGRNGGYPGELKAAHYIANEFKKIGLLPMGDVSRGRHNYFQEFKFHPYHPVKPWQIMTSRNVLGFIEGSDQQLKNEIVVIGAHYDGQGRAGQSDPTRAPATDSDEIWNSANDNATSVAAILEVARAIKTGKIATKRSLLFIAFGAEEHGMTGSIYYVTHPAFELSRHVAMINLEKLGRSPERPLTVNGAASSPSWQKILTAAQERTETKVSINPFAFPDSDHYPFGASRIPSIMFYVSTGADAHQASDSADKIDFARNAEAARHALAIALEVANQPTRPEFVAAPFFDLGLIAHLATNAEADAVGLTGNASGLKVTGVLPGLPAATAGLIPGDLILKFNDFEFHRDHTLASLMAMHRQILEGKFGQQFRVILLRNGKQSELTINLRQK
jgi:Zn-dependent M28 family amino/carboxypeptidase